MSSPKPLHASVNATHRTVAAGAASRPHLCPAQRRALCRTLGIPYGIPARSPCGTLTLSTKRCKAGTGKHCGLPEILLIAHQEQTQVCGSICWGNAATVNLSYTSTVLI